MSDREDHQAEGTAHQSIECKPLFDAATPELFRNNAFRITGLSVDATVREISKHADKLTMMAELGHDKSVHTGAFALKPPPSLDQIRDAIRRLKDPEERLLDEFFWFWPDEFGKSKLDPAIQALDSGDSDTASKIWTAKETNPDGVVALHNLAVMWHLTALEWERYTDRGELDTERSQQLERYWRNAFKRWTILCTDESLWEKVKGRVKQLDDPRLTTGFVRRMSAVLPEALGKVNAGLALAYAEKGKVETAKMHVRLMREIHGSHDADKTARLVLGPAVARVREQIRQAEQSAEGSAETADRAVRDLLAQSGPVLKMFELFFGNTVHDKIELPDEVANACVKCLVTYQRKTGDNQAFVDLLEATSHIAVASDIRDRIQNNIRIGKENLVYGLLNAIRGGSEPPRLKLQRFRAEIVPAIMRVGKVSGMSASFGPLGADSDDATKLLDEAAIVLREISIAAWNDHDDAATAIASNALALEYACNPEFRNRLSDDQITLRKRPTPSQGPPPRSQSTPPRTQPRAHAPPVENTSPSTREISSAQKTLAWIVGIIVLLILANVNSPGPSPTPNDPRPMPPAPTAPVSNPPPMIKSTPNVAPGKSTPTYRIPDSLTAEFDRDRQTIENERAKIRELEPEIASLNADIARTRKVLDREDQSAVDDYNDKVDRYNALLETVRSQERRLNQLVAAYNAKLDKYGR